MPRYGFAIDNRVCIGCHACTVACKSEHDVPLGVNRTWVKYIEKGEFPHTRRSFNVQRCNHCDDAPCVEICPVTSLYRRPDGIVDFDSDRCIGCTACMQACPYDALYLDPATQTAAKCNYCTHRVDAGYEPACVVVCPVEAIVSGDLDDPDSRIARLDRQQRVQYPKPEKHTRPKLFYVGGETAALQPTQAPPDASYLWSGQPTPFTLPQLEAAQAEAQAASGLGADGAAPPEAGSTGRARRVYDTRPKPGTWGWMVSTYVTTKAIAAGIILVSVGLHALGLTERQIHPFGGLAALFWLAATGALLVADLKQPRRFLYVMLRPQWKSWLVRGAYLLTALAAVTALAWLAELVGFAPRILGWIAAALAIGVATYTAFLFAQAKGRDYWQNPLLPVTMLVDAIVAGLAAYAVIEPLDGLAGAGDGGALSPARWAYGASVLALAALTAAEHLTPHPTANAALTARLIVRGPLAGWFWGGVVGVGLAAPALLLLAAPAATPVVAVLLLAGIAIKNHILVQAPQQVPLS